MVCLPCYEPGPCYNGERERSPSETQPLEVAMGMLQSPGGLACKSLVSDWRSLELAGVITIGFPLGWDLWPKDFFKNIARPSSALEMLCFMKSQKPFMIRYTVILSSTKKSS